jgi:hypothetical protein
MSSRADIVKAIEEELEQLSASLSAVGLTARFRGLVQRPMTVGSTGSTVEAKIGIYDQQDRLCDMLEFFVERENHLVVEPTDVRTWLRRELEQTIEDYPLGRGWEEVT